MVRRCRGASSSSIPVTASHSRSHTVLIVRTTQILAKGLRTKKALAAKAPLRRRLRRVHVLSGGAPPSGCDTQRATTQYCRRPISLLLFVGRAVARYPLDRATEDSHIPDPGEGRLWWSVVGVPWSFDPVYRTAATKTKGCEEIHKEL